MILSGSLFPEQTTGCAGKVNFKGHTQAGCGHSWPAVLQLLSGISCQDGNAVSAGSLHSIFSFDSCVKILDSLPVRDLRAKGLLSLHAPLYPSSSCPAESQAHSGSFHLLAQLYCLGYSCATLLDSPASHRRAQSPELPSNQACRGCLTPGPRRCWFILHGSVLYSLSSLVL